MVLQYCIQRKGLTLFLVGHGIALSFILQHSLHI